MLEVLGFSLPTNNEADSARVSQESDGRFSISSSVTEWPVCQVHVSDHFMALYVELPFPSFCSDHLLSLSHYSNACHEVLITFHLINSASVLHFDDTLVKRKD